jgi:peptide chain release factor 2
VTANPHPIFDRLHRLAASGPCVVAHRGDSRNHPENTLAAFRAAARLGVPMQEFDVRQLRDGTLVCVHDASFDRTTDASRKGYKVEILEQTEGEVAGIKSASLKVNGAYAYGTLRTETGVHRLVRKSPFDANARRHTSFASVFVYPEVDETVAVELNPAEIRVDTYRASGAGGQHVNKTDSAIRMTHLPTGLVVQCQNDRSQHRNRAEALAMLKSKLFELEARKKEAERQKLEDAKTDIGWGHQIRSYVLDQSRIKDLRTGVEKGHTQAVLDVELDDFIEASLKQGV